ncbi:nuclear transport factor 2 family protein [Rhodococcus sp. 1R11]|uniref:nuclear transport factor 2 family protein n=1 Tax=Rhodococcus sp. 1R11 TaxID=2559614 RepID=UPI00107185DC|nr:nuclear transport factor 2 family protein [Rhodococcus sp. 1R11]TFI45618.1 nuclear transport factor 2 family protein [Rhodococcus sp. 1R11]
MSPNDEPCSGTDLSTVLELERELQTAHCRCDTKRLTDLLAEDFTEVGASGAVWDKASILDLLGTEDSVEIEVLELSGRAISADFVLVHWISQTSGKRARRTSLWRRTTSGWELIHHQGTPLN